MLLASQTSTALLSVSKLALRCSSTNTVMGQALDSQLTASSKKKKHPWYSNNYALDSVRNDAILFFLT